MAKLVFIPHIRSKTWLHYSANTTSGVVILRDFSLSEKDKPKEIKPEESIEELKRLLAKEPNDSRDQEPKGIEEPRITDIGIWHRYIVELNKTLPVPDEERCRQHEEAERELKRKKLEHEVAGAWWQKYKWAFAALAGLVALIVAIALGWKQIVAAFS